MAASRPKQGRPAHYRTHTVANSVKRGDIRRIDVSMRNRLAELLDDPGLNPRDAPALAKRIMDLDSEIDAIDKAAAKADPVAAALRTGDERI